MTDLRAVKDFWESHVNNEYYTDKARASADYFAEIQARRYRLHYHLESLFAEIAGLGVQDKSLLEVGCGIGVDSLRLQRLGFGRVVGVDISLTALEVARRGAEVGARNTLFLSGDAEHLAFPNAAFDLVYSFGVIHHTPDVRAAVSEIHRVLAPGGKAFVMIYHSRSLVNWIHVALRLPYESPRNLQDHCPVVYRFSRRRARQLFSGFADVKLHSDYPFTYGLRWLSWGLPVAAQRVLGRAIGWHLMIEATKS